MYKLSMAGYFWKLPVSECAIFVVVSIFFHFREAKISNIKHHWWWKLNFVNQFFNFEKLILLEEDHALANDAFDIIGES